MLRRSSLDKAEQGCSSGFLLSRPMALIWSGVNLTLRRKAHVAVKLFDRLAGKLFEDVDGEGGSALLHHLHLLLTGQADEALGDDDADFFGVDLVELLTELGVGLQELVDDGGGDVLQVVLVDAGEALGLDILPCIRLDQLDPALDHGGTASGTAKLVR